jgi:single-strand DNA-binding protein
MVMIEGKLQTRKWTDQAGVEKYSTEVVMQNFDSKMLMLGGKGGGDAGGGDSDFGTGEYSRPARGAAKRNEDMDDDIPF